MTIVESKDELWNTVARNASSGESSKSEPTAPTSTVDLPPNPPSATNVPAAGGGISAVDDSCHRVYGKIYAMTNGGSVVTGEEEEECTMQVRAKLFKLDLKKGQHKDAEITTTDGDSQKDAAPDWSEVGVGPVKLLKPCAGLSPSGVITAHKLSRLVMRRESKVGGTGRNWS